MTETIIIEAEWDEGTLRCKEVTIEGRSIPYMGRLGVKIHRTADAVSRLVGNWQDDERKRNE